MAKAAVRRIAAPFRRDVSSGYQVLGDDESSAASIALRDAWQSLEIPARQRQLVDQQLAALRSGQKIQAFDVLVRLLETLVARHDGVDLTLLEVGCSSGYHAEIFADRGVRVAYRGCDYSPSFIEMARRYYPSLPFEVADATALPQPSNSIDIVLSGCCLLHIPDYESAIRESARVARRYVVFHRTPVFHDRATTHYRKKAYGIETVEIHFNEEELVSLFAKHGLRVIAVSTLDVAWVSGGMYATKEYVCEKAVSCGEGRNVGM